MLSQPPHSEDSFNCLRLFSFMCMGLLSVCTSVHHLHEVPTETRRWGRILELELRVAIWVLGIKPESFARAAGALNCRGISPVQAISYHIWSYSPSLSTRTCPVLSHLRATHHAVHRLEHSSLLLSTVFIFQTPWPYLLPHHLLGTCIHVVCFCYNLFFL